MKKLSSIYKYLSGVVNIIGLPNQNIETIEYDSRKCRFNSCFVATTGLIYNGHDFIADAIQNGAKTIICEKIPDQNDISHEVTFIIVNDSRKALAEISHAFYDFPSQKLKIIGITGTNGKTTITYIFKSIFEAGNKNGGIIGTTGALYGNIYIPTNHTTPESKDIAEILHSMVEAGVEWVAMEVSSHALKQQRVACIDFIGAIFTNLTHDHLDYHSSIEDYADSKKMLFDSLKSSSKAVIFADSDYSEYVIRDTKAHIFTVGRNKKCDYKIIKESSGLVSSEFLLYGGDKIIDAKTSLIGKFNNENAALVAAACNVLNIDYGAIQKGLSLTKGAPGRMQKVIWANGAIALIDYAHTPDALEKALLTCKELIKPSAKEPKLITVFGCGGDRDKSKRPQMGNIASTFSDIVIITSDNPRREDPFEIIKQIHEGTKIGNAQVIIEPERSYAIEKAYKLSVKNDIILIAGKGHEKYQIIGNVKYDFDDIAEAEKYS